MGMMRGVRFVEQHSRLSGFVFVVVLLVLWELLARTIDGFAFYLPAFSTILSSLATMTVSGEMPREILHTLGRLFLAYACSIVVGVPLGTLIGYSRTVYTLSEPTLELLRPAPAVAIIPIAALMLGLDIRMKVFVIAWAAFWPILLSAIDGVRSIDPILLETAHTYGYGGGRIVRRIVLPAALPYMMAGLRLGLTISLILAIFVEIFTSGSGLGFLIVEYQAAIRIAEVYAVIVMVALLGYLLNLGFVTVEGRVIRWYHASHETG